ncbi:MAG TPA: hypothetical protein DEE98_02895 [Elusimicrobia bacterium]|nr:MAG: hypothetical protein A2278_07725 [Elusimicrobia bacterium RIFOXYA12_FULL_49_49]OGS09405.1 MAG: hypothetical protein A2386_07955 [Elusimicrobia bacterium RIFOXYB1_FULL_48_9]OGS16047.1 MAG: hypothetical protein A2251_02540 [Elusimicrobia bacterium RIFOXYA2_FULL_47_53]OGS25782.1 MAG: hypothetical protein A2339_05095 [Elusimicrobia bacterium RIFOXYB12_FULL_50_12]OGS30201.1 MAG: hypothetical protein A2323_01995 [Elusimicrobia bacterium RIFOXYB2_FULL_46_23]HBU69311.1 hypothetical protein [El
MDLLTPVGLIIGCLSVWYAMHSASISSALYDLASLVLVLGGTIGSTFMTYPWYVIKRVPSALWLFIVPPKWASINKNIDRLYDLSSMVLLNGIDSLSDALHDDDDRFLKDGVQMLLYDLPGETIKDNMENEIASVARRHQQVQKAFISMGAYAPVYGLLGTLVGIIGVMKYLGDPVAMGQNMMVAIITTFYGIFGANFIFLPAAGKLETYSEHEILVKQIIMIGVVSIKNGVHPDVVKEKLNKFLSQSH